METTIELPHATDLRYSYIQGVSHFPSLWEIREGTIYFNGSPIFANLFDQRAIYRLVRQEENRHEQEFRMG